MTQSNRHKFEKGRAARLAAVQALYQISETSETASAVIEQFIIHRFNSGDYPVSVDVPLFRKLITTANDRQHDIIDIISANLNHEWSLDRLESILKAILQVATAELLGRLTTVPTPVIISEYVDIAHGFFEGKEPGFVNSYLDKVAKSLGHSLSKPKK
ncbi:MAG: transcription antitermination factor NusB [Caedibacter sp. 37-49]|nr:MAG: transcription antitermination factor NusB [Caedibacter sp. 37-49]